MFQDEARFGRMSGPRSCWAPAPHRPVVNLVLVQEFHYEYAAVSPWDGCLDFMTASAEASAGVWELLGVARLVLMMIDSCVRFIS